MIRLRLITSVVLVVVFAGLAGANPGDSGDLSFGSPEIDPGSIAGAIALLSSGALWLTARRKHQSAT